MNSDTEAKQTAMIQIQNPAAVAFIAMVLIAVLLWCVHRVTAGRFWGWLWYGINTRPRFLLALLCGIMVALAGATATGWSDLAQIQTGRWAARFLLIVLLEMIGVSLILTCQRHRRQKAQLEVYRGFIQKLKAAAHPSAAATIQAAIRALNHSGETVVDLSGGLLEGADLRGIRLHGADLSQAHLEGANLQGVGLSGADLRNVKLAGADLREIFFYRADLRGADLRQADLRRADLREADLRGARLDGCGLEDARLEDARLDGASLSGARMENTQVSVVQLLKTETLAHAVLEPRLRLRLVAAGNPPLGLARRLLRIDGSVPSLP